MKLNINKSLITKQIFAIVLFFVFCFLFQFEGILAIGVGAKPSFLDLELKVGQSKETKILVYNISKEAGIFQVFPDELNDWIKVEPNNFRLEAGENKEVKINILAKEEGKKAINLSISAKPLDRQNFSVNPGLKIPLSLNVTGKYRLFLASISEIFSEKNLPKLSIGILIIILNIFFLKKYLKNRKRVTISSNNLPNI